jgi:predicted RNA-binding protein with PIN domain
MKRGVNDRYRSSKSIASLETKHASIISMQSPARYLIVDGHSVIFAWPELRRLHERRSSLAREALVKQLRDYQDWTGVHVVVVFDGKGKKVEATSDPADVQIFYSRSGQSADAIIERLASKYAKRYELVVATSDSMEVETVHACGAESISPDGLRGLIADVRR